MSSIQGILLTWNKSHERRPLVDAVIEANEGEVSSTKRCLNSVFHKAVTAARSDSVASARESTAPQERVDAKGGCTTRNMAKSNNYVEVFRDNIIISMGNTSTASCYDPRASYSCKRSFHSMSKSLSTKWMREEDTNQHLSGCIHPQNELRMLL